MKAARLHHRGGPEQIVIDDAPLPQPAPGEVRIRVHAAALTPGELSWDETYLNPDRSPRLPTIPGHDVAGTIDALAPDVTTFKLNDPVYALINFPLNGSASEFVTLPAADVAPAPRSLTPIEVAAVPLSALTAWQALFEHGKLAAGQRLLIHGGAGGVGAYAIQLAKHAGAHILATASAKNFQTLRDLGAHELVDYTTTRFEDAARDIDLVFDTVGGDLLTRSFASLRNGGTFVSIAGKPDPARAASLNVTPIFFIVHPSRPQLEQIAALLDAGKIRPHIQQIFPLDQARQAFERTLAGHLTGKIVLRIQTRE
jgi:NADPH:quinone reductase-like Zn-dependent oxidoreductase